MNCIYIELIGPSQFLPMSRQNLQQELLRDIKSENIILGKRLVSFEDNKDIVSVTLDDGSSLEGCMLIGADGIKSTTRKCLHQKYPDILGPEPSVKYSKYTLLGGEARIDHDKKPGELVDFTWIFGNGKLGVVLPTKPEEGEKHIIFWSVGLHSDQPMGVCREDESDEHKKYLTELIQPFNEHFNFEKYVKNSSKFVIWDIYELDRQKNTTAWGNGNVTLLGDAAHAVTPWVGQGAGISIEDAFDLTHRILKNPDNLQLAIKEYEKIRIPRASNIRNMANFNFKFFNLLQIPALTPFFTLYYKIISIPTVFDFFTSPLVGFDNPKESLPNIKEQK